MPTTLINNNSSLESDNHSKTDTKTYINSPLLNFDKKSKFLQQNIIFNNNCVTNIVANTTNNTYKINLPNKKTKKKNEQEK